MNCRGLFERHKLLLSLQMAARIAASQGSLPQDQWKILLEGTGGMAEAGSSPNPAASWLSESAWQDLAKLSSMPAFEVSISGMIFPRALSVLLAALVRAELTLANPCHLLLQADLCTDSIVLSWHLLAYNSMKALLVACACLFLSDSPAD